MTNIQKILILFISAVLLSPAVSTQETDTQWLNDTLPGKGNLDSLLRSYISRQLPYLKADHLHLSLQNKQESLTGNHFTYQQTCYGLPVYNTQVKINISSSRVIRSLHYTLYPENRLPTDPTTLSYHKDQSRFDRITQWIKDQYGTYRHLTITPVIYPSSTNGTSYPAYRATFFHPSRSQQLEILINRELELIQENDITRYFNKGDTTARGKVYNPDPLTTSGHFYNPPYVDNNDNSTLALFNQLVPVSLTVSYSKDSFWLENEHVIIKDFSAPNVPPPVSTTDSFIYDRSDTAFEAINAFYHISAFYTYIDSLGFTNVQDNQISVDARATQADNSYFTPSPPQLGFGTGGVDDGEDADVIIHEFGHAITEDIAPNTRTGHERKALEEGWGDYLAASYSRHLSDTMWDSVFTWDGWNNYWSGRTASSSKVYPEDLNSSIHADGEIWSSALMEIWAVLGRKKTDRLHIESIYNWSKNMSMRTAARFIMQTDTLLYNAKKADTIQAILVNRGLLKADTTSKNDKDSLPQSDTTYDDIYIEQRPQFATQQGPLRIRLPNSNKPAQLYLYNMKGQIIDHHRYQGRNTIYYENLMLTGGIYILRVITPRRRKQVKLYYYQ